MIRRFNLNTPVPNGGWKWLQGEVVSWGMRNAVGITLSIDGTKLWTVENSADQIMYTQNGQNVDIHIVRVSVSVPQLSLGTYSVS
jgi:hypothetical protein